MILPLQLSTIDFILLFFLKILFIYLTERERQPEREETQAGENGRGRSSLPVEEPDVGLDPLTPESRPEPKADA